MPRHDNSSLVQYDALANDVVANFSAVSSIYDCAVCVEVLGTAPPSIKVNCTQSSLFFLPPRKQLPVHTNNLGFIAWLMMTSGQNPFGAN